jgi:hypothetical protein
MNHEEYRALRHEIAEQYGRLIRWQLRRMRIKWAKPRTYRLPREARALRSLLNEARAAGVDTGEAAPGASRRRRKGNR